MLPILVPIVAAVVQGLVTPAKHAVQGVANKALAAGGITAVSVGAMPSELELFAALGYFLDWPPETVHNAATIAAFLVGFVTTYVIPNKAPPDAGATP
jgi:hypothetical protein